jgi:hypothetical protein
MAAAGKRESPAVQVSLFVVPQSARALDVKQNSPANKIQKQSLFLIPASPYQIFPNATGRETAARFSAGPGK